MISRVAEHCFWMSRYLERAENTARILEVNQTLLLDFQVPIEHQWGPLLIISGNDNMPGERDAETVQYYLTWESSNPTSVVSSLNCAREDARNIREVISAEMWEQLNSSNLWLHSPLATHLYDRNRSEFYTQIRRINQMIHGISEGTMAHGEAWEFFQLGKYLERSCQTARILDVKYHILLPTPEDVGTPVDSAHWVAILTSCSGYEPYHKQCVAADLGVTVADFLIFDPLFPRSVLYCLRACLNAAHAIADRPPAEPDNDVEKGLSGLVERLATNNIETLVSAGLHEALISIVNEIQEVGDAIQVKYFDVDQSDPVQ